MEQRLRHIVAGLRAPNAYRHPTGGGGGGRRATADGGGRNHAVAYPAIVGHRGLLLNAPENTLASFSACAALRVGFEFDVDRTFDGTLVCIHDSRVDRTTNGSGEVGQHTLEQLQKLDAGRWFDTAFRGEHVPTISEVLALAATAGELGGTLLCDIKAAGVEAELLSLFVGHAEVLERTVFIGQAISDHTVRDALAAAAARLDLRAQVACLATFASDLEAAIADEHSNWVYVRFMPSRSEVLRCHNASKRVVVAGTTPALRSQPQTQVWAEAVASGVDAFLTDWPFELPKTPVVHAAADPPDCKPT